MPRTTLASRSLSSSSSGLSQGRSRKSGCPVRATSWNRGGISQVCLPRSRDPAGRLTSSSMPDVVTMDKIVSLARRRGFVFPSSEIYGGLGSSYDYGHYGVLAKNKIRTAYVRTTVTDRDAVFPLLF